MVSTPNPITLYIEILGIDRHHHSSSLYHNIQPSILSMVKEITDGNTLYIERYQDNGIDERLANQFGSRRYW
jgi:hypothetical protein